MHMLWNMQNMQNMQNMDSNSFANDLSGSDLLYSKGFMNFGCPKPKKMFEFWNFLFVFEAVDWVCNEIMKYAATRQRKTRILYDFSIPDIYLFWYATALFKPVKSTPYCQKRVKIGQNVASPKVHHCQWWRYQLCIFHLNEEILKRINWNLKENQNMICIYD